MPSSCAASLHAATKADAITHPAHADGSANEAF
jgi:hypothetical protein